MYCIGMQKPRDKGGYNSNGINHVFSLPGIYHKEIIGDMHKVPCPRLFTLMLLLEGGKKIEVLVFPMIRD